VVGGGACLITGVFGEYGDACGTVTLVLTSGGGVVELMNHRMHIAVMGMIINAKNKINPSGVMRK
jgi:hypothetical protein